MSYFAMTGASGLETWEKESIAPVLARSLPVHYRTVQRDREPTGSLQLHGRKGRRRGLYLGRVLVENSEPCKDGQGPIGSHLEKGLIESGMS